MQLPKLTNYKLNFSSVYAYFFMLLKVYMLQDRIDIALHLEKALHEVGSNFLILEWRQTCNSVNTHETLVMKSCSIMLTSTASFETGFSDVSVSHC